jgi:hypothetical protein
LRAYSELPNLGIIHAQNLGLLACTQMATGNKVDEEEDQARSEEGVSETRRRVSKLVTHLNPVLVEPTTGNYGGSIKMRYIVTR